MIVENMKRVLTGEVTAKATIGSKIPRAGQTDERMRYLGVILDSAAVIVRREL